jgi:hypothetical protein
MFTIDSDAHVSSYPGGSVANPEDSGTYIHTQVELAALISTKPGEWSVALWNQLPGVIQVHTPPGEKAAKFRNKQTATERIWNKLCELYPDAILESDMPKKETRLGKVLKGTIAVSPAKVAPRKDGTFKAPRLKSDGTGRKSAWAEELTEELRKRFKAGDDFALSDVYKLIPAFQRRHKENHHVAARLRTTLAQDLRGNGIVKSLSKGKYRLMAWPS